MIFFVFLLLTSFLFGVVVLCTRPTRKESALDRRITDILQSHGESLPATPLVPAHLEVAQPGRFKGLDGILGGFGFARTLQLLIVQGQTSTSVGAVVVGAAALFTLTLATLDFITDSALIAVISAPLAATAPLLYLQYRKTKRLAAFNAALPDTIDLCGRSLRVGHSLVAALSILAEEAAEPARTEFAEVFKKQNYGLPLRDALLQMLDRVPSPDLRVFVTGVLVQKDTGGNLAEILDRIVQVVRERIRIARDIKVHTAQGRLTGWILCLLPIMMLLLINLFNPGYSKVLFETPTGHKLLYAGAALLMVGGLLIRQIIHGIEV